MKKTFISLLALAGVALGNQSITIGSYYTKDNVKYDAVNAFAGKTENDIIAATGFTADVIDNLAFDSTKSFTLNTKDMLVSDASLTKETVLTLTSLSVISRTNSAHVADDTTLSIIIDGTTYSTTNVTHNGYSNDNDYGLLTYTFSGTAPTFKLGDELTFTFTISSEKNADNKVPDDNKLPMGSFIGLSGAPVIFTNNNKNWQGAFQLTASIPEPTTATLSLLALAGLAARRRRK